MTTDRSSAGSPSIPPPAPVPSTRDRRPPRRPRNGSGTADFVDIVALDALAKTAADHRTEGRRVAVIGRLRHRGWTTADGQKRSKLSVVADGVIFLDQPKTVAAPTADEAEAADWPVPPRGVVSHSSGLARHGGSGPPLSVCPWIAPGRYRPASAKESPMSISSDRSAPGRGPSPLRAGVLTGASWAVWALWVVCAVVVGAMFVEAVFDAAGALF